MERSRDDRSLGDLLAELMRETASLVRQEVQLATTELTQKASRVGKDLGALVIGGAVIYAGFLLILAAATIFLAGLGLPLWVAALLVGLVVAVVGYFLVQRGLAALRREDLTPRQTMETLQEDTQWVKEQMR